MHKVFSLLKALYSDVSSFFFDAELLLVHDEKDKMETTLRPFLKGQNGGHS